MVAIWLTTAGIFFVASILLWLFFDVSMISILGGLIFLMGLNMVYPPIFMWNGWYLGYPGPEDAVWVLIVMKISKLFRLTKAHAILISLGSWFIWKSIIATLILRLGESMLGLDPALRSWFLEKAATFEIFGISIGMMIGVAMMIPALWLIIQEWRKPW